ISCRRVMPDVACYDRGAGYRVIQPRRRLSGTLFEVRDEHAVRRANAEEIVHIAIAALGLGPALSDEWDGVRNATSTGARSNAGAVALEPCLDRERGSPQAGC